MRLYIITFIFLTFIGATSTNLYADQYSAQKSYFNDALKGKGGAIDASTDKIKDTGLKKLDKILKEEDSAEAPIQRKVRKVLQERSIVNGVQGRYMPKKVWEDDVDNEAGLNKLKKSSTKKLSRAASGKINAPKKAWEHK